MPKKQLTQKISTPDSQPLKCACHDKPDKKNPTLQRKKLWELQPRFHCSVVGTCLTQAELRQLCRKANVAIDPKVSDYELHCSFVNIAEQSAYPSRLLHKHLDSKYKRSIQQCRKIHSNNELKQLWLDAIKKGDIAGTFWALVTHPGSTDKLLDQIYGDIHMLSHLAGTSTRVDMQAYTLQCKRADNLETQLAKMRQDKKRIAQDREQILRTLSEHMTQTLASKRCLQQAQKRLLQFESGSELSEIRKQLSTQSSQLHTSQIQKESAENAAKEWQQLALTSEDRNLRLEQKLAESQQERNALEASLSHFLSGTCQDVCPVDKGNTRQNIDLCNLCILYVGGRSNQKSHFRMLVERYNGRFIHHDGGREDNRHHLNSILPRADAVLCPMDCVSHDAVRRIKQFCNRHSKPLIILPRGSLSAFAHGLARVSF